MQINEKLLIPRSEVHITSKEETIISALPLNTWWVICIALITSSTQPGPVLLNQLLYMCQQAMDLR